jgi:radical SAM superfamily enzyme YgiQ (UPF0313 family)
VSVLLVNAGPMKNYSVANLVYFPTSLVSLSTVLEAADVKVRLVDRFRERDTIEDIAAMAREPSTSLVLLHFTTKEAPDAVAIADAIRASGSSARIAAVGLYATMYPEHVAADESFDFVIEGDGEPAVVELVRQVESGTSSAVANVWQRRGKTALSVRRPVDHLDVDLDGIPLLSWDVVDMSEYLNRELAFVGDFEMRRVVRFSGSRGCVYKCNFCTDPFKGYQRLSNERMLEQLDHVVDKFDPDVVFFEDPEFFVRRPQTLALADEFAERYRFQCLTTSRAHYYRPDYISQEFMRKHANRWLMWDCGAETANAARLKEMQKGVTLAHLRQVADYAGAVGVRAGFSFMLGMPGETEADMLETVRFMEELKARAAGRLFITYQYYQPIGRTPMAELAAEHGFPAPTGIRDWQALFDPATGSTRIQLHPWIARPEFINYLMLVVKYVINAIHRPTADEMAFADLLSESWLKRSAADDWTNLWESDLAIESGRSFFTL